MHTVVLALLIDGLTGDPDMLWRRTGHPVAWFGAVIDGLDRRLNRGSRRGLKGALALALALAVFVTPAALLGLALSDFSGGWVVEAVLASTLLAHRSLHQHVARVAAADGLEDARAAVARIVGREVAALEQPGIARAGLEALSESLSDAVVAPAFWLAVGGLPGLVAYKVVNTADSMIGHRTARHRAFGAAAARLDDLANLVPARLTALLVLLAAPHALPRAGTVARDAGRHVSPNAGWPESAFAAALGVSLGGPRSYAGRTVEGAWLNPSGATPTRRDLARGLRLSIRVGALHVLAYAALAAL